MTDPRQFLLNNFHKAVEAVTPGFVLPPYVAALPVTGRLVILAMGKAAEAMADSALKTLRQNKAFNEARVSALAVIRKGDKMPGTDPLLTVMEAAHPHPDASSVAGAEALLKRAATATKEDTVLCLISGGASALTTCPAEGLSLEDFQGANTALIRGGVPIDKMNTLRKHLSRFSGGRLRLAAGDARVLTLMISDVPGDDPCVIGSGPTVPDGSTFEDARNVVREFDLLIPAAAQKHLDDARHETLKASDPRIQKDEAHIIASSTKALEAGAAHGKAAGFDIVNAGIIEGEAGEVGKEMARRAMELSKTISKPTLLISGGELTVTIPKNASIGVGGRNSRFLLAFLEETKGAKGIHALSCGTDGIDYAAAAGAVMTDGCYAEAQRLGLNPSEFMARFDSHSFFKPLDGLVKGEATQTNVGDYRVILVEKA